MLSLIVFLGTVNLIRVRIVVGMKDKKLSEQFQVLSEFTSEKAITKTRQSEKATNFPTGKFTRAPTS